MFRICMVALPALTALLAFACAREAGPPGVSAGPDEGAVVATVDAQPVTQDQLDSWIKDQLFEREVSDKNAAAQYEIRSNALEGFINQHVLEAEAERRGITPESVLAQTVQALGPVSDEDVAGFFEKHRDRFRPEDTLETRGAQIRQFLESERQEKALAVLRSQADVKIAIEAPRFEVAKTGPSIGPDDALITIVEFSDYQCPFCSRAEPVVKQVLEKYPNQVRLVFRHLPLDSIHPRARPAAEAAVCAEQQDKFWPFHEKLFANQRALGDEQLKGYATEIGLDVTAFEACLGNPEIKARVQTDVEAAQAAGISGTPAFFVNGVMLSGAKPLEAFVEVIEAELESDGEPKPANAS